MADRFWVGGTGDINDTARWAATSGGAGGQSVPTAADNAYFDGLSDRLTVQSVTSITRVSTTATVTATAHGYSNGHTVTIAGANEGDYNGTFTISNVATDTFDYTVANAPATPATGTITVARRAAFTVTINVLITCRDFIIGDGIVATALSQTMTLAGVGGLLTYGSLFFPAVNFVSTYSGQVAFVATTTGHTITTNGAAIPGVVTISGVGGAWTLGSSCSLGSGAGQLLRLNAGTLTTNNFNVTAAAVDRQGSVNFILNLGSSTVTVTGTGGVGFTASTNFTINPGTSTISISPDNVTNIDFGVGLTYYNVTGGIVAGTIGNNTTFNNLTIRTRTNTNVAALILTGNITVNGTLSVAADNTSPIKRQQFFSDVPLSGAQRTITAAAITIGDGVDFRDIAIAGAAAPFNASTKLTGDLGNNSGITFPAPKTVYWNLAGSQGWSANAWATTPTGTPAVANFPLAQDTAVVTEAGAAGTISTDYVNWPIPNLTFDNGVSPRSSGVTFNFASSPSFYGDVKLSSGVTLTGASGAVFFGRRTQNITSAGKIFPSDVLLYAPGGSLVLQDNLVINPARVLNFIAGTIDLNNRVLEAGIFVANNPYTRVIAFGTIGKLSLSGNSNEVINMYDTNNFSYTGTSNVELTYSGATGTRSINLGSNSARIEANALNIRVTAGFDIVRVNNGSWYKNLILDDAFSGTLGTVTAPYAGLGFCLGNMRFSPNMSLTLGSAIVFTSIANTQQLTSSGKTIPVGVTKDSAGTLQLQDSLVLAAGQTFTHTAGTVSLNGRSITTPVYNISNSNVRSLIFGSGELVLNGTGTVWNATTSTSLTISPGSGKISIIDASATGKTFAGGNVLTYPELVIAGDASTSTVTLTGSNRFAKLTNTRTVAYTVEFPNAQTVVNAWALNGTDGNLVTLSRTGGSGQFTITSGTGGILIAQFVSISNSIFSPGGNGYAVRSTNGGGNTGWVFGPPAFGKFLMFFTP